MIIVRTAILSFFASSAVAFAPTTIHNNNSYNVASTINRGQRNSVIVTNALFGDGGDNVFDMARKKLEEGFGGNEETSPINGSSNNNVNVDADVLIVGAGAAGVGTALMLTETFGMDKSRVMMVERGDDVGESFRRWPKEMRFISPSFNQQGWTESFDLNAVSHGTSPAFSLHTEHPSGKDYAAYLSAMVETSELNIRKKTEVVSVTPISSDKANPMFNIDISSGDKKETLTAKYIVWAAGEFQYPKMLEKTDDDIPGSELCMHNSEVRSWRELPGDEFVIIGGYESGVDAAVNLAAANKKCKVVASTPCWDVKTDDPSYELAPYTADRLRTVTSDMFAGPHPELLAPLRVVGIEKNEGEEGGYNVHATWKSLEPAYHAPLRELIETYEKPGEEGSKVVLHTPNKPILCTGFEGSVKVAAGHLFDFADENNAKGCLAGAPLLKRNDESTKVPGVYLVGPSVQHEDLSFCFVYKFRQRFAVVAESICKGLGMDTSDAVEECQKTNMYLEKFDCCEDTCTDVC